MATSLKEATYSSEMGYIDRVSDIGEIMEHLTAITLKELNDYCSFDYLETFDVVLEVTDIPQSYLNSLSYTDMLCVTDSIRFNYETRVNDSDYAACRLYYVEAIARALLRAARRCSWVKLFLSVSVRAYMEYLDVQAGSTDGAVRFAAFRIMVQNAIDVELNDSYTIGCFLEKARSAMQEYWYPLKDIDEYVDRIYAAHEVVDALLVSGMKTAYPGQFSLERIKRKAVARERLEKCAFVERSK